MSDAYFDMIKPVMHKDIPFAYRLCKIPTSQDTKTWQQAVQMSVDLTLSNLEQGNANLSDDQMHRACEHHYHCICDGIRCCIVMCGTGVAKVCHDLPETGSCQKEINYFFLCL